MSLFAELKRRNVVRVGVAYAVIGWVIAQVAEFAFENFGAPDWVLKSVVVILLLGLPLALFFAWAFEITPEGVKREKDVDRSESITHSTGRKLDFVIIGALVIALGYFVWERQSVPEPAEVVAGESSDAASAESPDTPGKRSIAVLPFVNMSSDEEQEWFADGLTEEILNSLAKMPDLLVTARTTTFGYKGSTDPIPEIAAELNVEHILEGSVRRGGDTFRITAQLIRATDGFHLWSETYDRPMQDIIATQEDIAIQIASVLETALDPAALAEMMDSGTRSFEAYEAFLTGLGALRAFDRSGDAYEVLNAVESFDRAVEIDPTFAKAYGYISLFWSLQLQSNQIAYGITEEPVEVLRAKRDEALANAIRYEKDPVQRLSYEAVRARDQLDFRRALRLRQEYFDANPTADLGIGSLFIAYRDLGMHREVTDLIREIYAKGEYPERFAYQALQALRTVEDADFMREFTQMALEKYGENANLLYQAHRQLLWAGDIDGASNLVPRIMSSRLGEDNLALVSLRQACAEKNLAEASDIHNRILEKYADEFSIQWLAYGIMGDTEAAAEMFVPYDERGEFNRIMDYLSYAHFDPRPYPNFMEAVAGQGFEDREILELPYRCNR